MDLMMNMKNGGNTLQVALLICCLTAFIPLNVLAYENCTTQRTGGAAGICPDYNTCCRMIDGRSGCIPSDLGKYNASCCDDGITGCGVGYTCHRGTTTAKNEEGDYCLEMNTTTTLTTTSIFDPIVKVLPRYRLCRTPDIEEILGLHIDAHSDLAYYSSHGPIENVLESHHDVDMVLIVIHGAGRNADDYFCSTTAAVELQTTYENVMVVAPRFYSEADNRNSPSFLYWEDISDGPWRYGADSLGPTQISSYTALDKLVEAITISLPDIDRLVIAGHSSGGQTVNRWAFLTPNWFEQTMKAVVANPSSYVYLSPLRFVNDNWVLPEKEDCPQYNQWEWGLEDGGDADVPYKQQQLKNFSFAIERYGTRKVDYLVGSLDVCNVSNPEGWCNSHGLEMTCMDELQGSTRYERNVHYLESLRRIGIDRRFQRQIIVEGVGHDHALMFQSPEGLIALFDVDTDENSSNKNQEQSSYESEG